MQDETTAEVKEDVPDENTAEVQEDVPEEVTAEVQSEVQERTTAEVPEGTTVAVSTEAVLVPDLPHKCDEVPENLPLTKGQEPEEEQSIPFDQCSPPEKARKVMTAGQCSVDKILNDKTDKQDGDRFVRNTLPQLGGEITQENIEPLPTESVSWHTISGNLIFHLMSILTAFCFYYVSMFFYVGTRVSTWTEGPATPNCECALTIESELTWEPEQPLKNMDFKSECRPIPADSCSWRTAMISILTCSLSDVFAAAFMSTVMRPQAYAWTEGPFPTRCDHRWRCFVKPECERLAGMEDFTGSWLCVNWHAVPENVGKLIVDGIWTKIFQLPTTVC